MVGVGIGLRVWVSTSGVSRQQTDVQPSPSALHSVSMMTSPSPSSSTSKFRWERRSRLMRIWGTEAGRESGGGGQGEVFCISMTILNWRYWAKGLRTVLAFSAKTSHQQTIMLTKYYVLSTLKLHKSAMSSTWLILSLRNFEILVNRNDFGRCTQTS